MSLAKRCNRMEIRATAMKEGCTWLKSEMKLLLPLISLHSPEQRTLGEA